MAENPFAPPEEDAPLPQGLIVSDRVLATPFSRFGARFLDQMLMLFAVIPGFLIGISSGRLIDKEMSLLVAVGLGLLGAIAVVGYNWMLITTEGRTVGKRALGIRIVTTDGEPLGFLRGVVMREWVITAVDTVVSLFTGLGVLGLIDGVMVFSQGNRTLHDRIANTQVVRDHFQVGDAGVVEEQQDWLDEL